MQNYELVYYVVQNVGIIGILEYPKIYRFVKDSIKMSFLNHRPAWSVAARDRCALRAALPCAHARDSTLSSCQLVRSSTTAPLPPPLAAGRNSLCAIAARFHAAAPDFAAAGSLTADRPGRRLLALSLCSASSAKVCARMRRVVVLGRGSARLDRRAGPTPARRRSRLTLRNRSSLTGRRAGPRSGGPANRRPAGRRLLALVVLCARTAVRDRVRQSLFVCAARTRLDRRAAHAPARR